MHHLLYDFFRSLLLPLLHSKLLLDFFCSFTHHFALQTKFGVVLGKLTIRYSGMDGHPNDDHSESVPGCWHSTFFKTIVLLRYVNSSYTFLVNFKSVGRRTVQLLDRLPWQPEVKTESFNFLNVWTTFATGDKSNLHQRGNFDTLSKKKSCLKGGERKLLIFRLGSRTKPCIDHSRYRVLPW